MRAFVQLLELAAAKSELADRLDQLERRIVLKRVGSDGRPCGSALFRLRSISTSIDRRQRGVVRLA